MDTISIITYYLNVVWTYISFYVTYLFDRFKEFSFIIKVASISVTICVCLIIYMIVWILRKSWKRHRRRKRLKKLDDKYGEAIRHVMSADSKERMTRDEVLEVLGLDKDQSTNYPNLLKKAVEKFDFCRLVYQARISDEAEQDRTHNIQVLLSIFDLPAFLEKVANKGTVSRQVEAMMMLNAFKITVNLWLANRMIGSKRKRARQIATYASIMTNTNNDMEYFESEYFDNNCCLYDEIQLGYVLQRRRSSKRKIPNMAHWAHIHKNPASQCIFIRMMRQFNQKEYCSELEDMFDYNADKSVIEEISRTWGYLQYAEGEELMRDIMLTQPDDTKVTIMHALARINSGNSIPAIVDLFQHSGSDRVKYEALRSLYNSGTVGRAKFEELRFKATEKDKRLFEFFMNPLTADDIELPKSDIYKQVNGDNLYSVV